MWNYKPLFRLLLEKDLKKSQLRNLFSFGQNLISKFSKGEPVNMESLGKLCEYFNCQLSDLVEYIPENTPQNHENQK